MNANSVDGESDRDIHDKSSVRERMSKKNEKNLQPGEALSTLTRRDLHQQKWMMMI